jgi:hypothetical protein
VKQGVLPPKSLNTGGQSPVFASLQMGYVGDQHGILV